MRPFPQLPQLCAASIYALTLFLLPPLLLFFLLYPLESKKSWGSWGSPPVSRCKRGDCASPNLTKQLGELGEVGGELGEVGKVGGGAQSVGEGA